MKRTLISGTALFLLTAALAVAYKPIKAFAQAKYSAYRTRVLYQAAMAANPTFPGLTALQIEKLNCDYSGANGEVFSTHTRVIFPDGSTSFQQSELKNGFKFGIINRASDGAFIRTYDNLRKRVP